MAGTSDEEMEKLVALADQISDDFISGFHEIQTLKSNYNAEISNRQSIELTCSTLKQENQRLKNLHLQTLNNLLTEIQHRGDSSSSKEEELTILNQELLKKEGEHRNAVESIKKINEEKVRDLEVEIGEILKQKREELNDRLLKKDEDHRNAMEMMKKMYEKKIEEISGQKREDEAAIYQLHHELISTRKKLKEVEVKWKEEIEDMKDYVCAEQQEKEEMSKKFRDLEKELLVTKMSDNHVSTSDKQLEMMKQKMMKLRRENEVLRRQTG